MLLEGHQFGGWGFTSIRLTDYFLSFINEIPSSHSKFFYTLCSVTLVFSLFTGLTIQIVSNFNKFFLGFGSLRCRLFMLLTLFITLLSLL